ncbi:hypothetical protein ACWCQN_47445 [Streptomyces sp. NPDC001984]
MDFHSDAPLHRLPTPSAGPDADHLDGNTPVGEVTDDPLDLSPRRRTYRARPVYRRSVPLPDTPRGGLGADYLTALHAYLNSTASELQGGAA